MNSRNNIYRNLEKQTRWKHWHFLIMFLLVVATAFFVCDTYAQDLINNGHINNTGILRVKNRVIGLQDTIGGVFDYFGANQIVPAVQYRDLLLTGSGIKQTSGGNFTVTGNVRIAPAVTLQVETNAVLRLEGTLSEQGYLSGSIQKVVELSGSTTSSDFGNIGVSILWSGVAPGLTNAIRTSGIPQRGNGNESIRRYYDIVASTNSGLNTTLILKYDNSELNGHDPSKLLLWKSVDGGQTWRVQGGSIDTASCTVIKHGITSFGRWTLADSTRPLGQITPIASFMVVHSGNDQRQPILTTLQPFVVMVTDADGHPVANESVSFSITAFPAGAEGQVLSNTLVFTDENGFAATTLTLGNKIGVYQVSTEAAFSAEPLVFTATATVGIPYWMILTSGNNQSALVGSTLPQPFIVSVIDSGGNAVPGVNVRFEIINTPTGATGQQLTATNILTDSLGQAATVLTLGNKVGIYTVAAYSASLSGSPVHFTATAYQGTAAYLLLTSGNNQTQDIGTTLAQPFVVTVTDAGGNAVAGTRVNFGISRTPLGARGQILSDTSVVTNSLGLASTVLRLGSKTGEYTVVAVSEGLAGSPVIFTASATAFLADANGDGRANIADLTTVFDKVLERITLSDENFTRADVDTNNVVDRQDASIILNGLLEGRWDGVSLAAENSVLSTSPSYASEFELTANGLRFNLINTLPVKGVQMALRFRNQIDNNILDLVFNRGKHMQVPIKSENNIMRIVLYNNENAPIDTGSSSIFRLRFNNLSLEDFTIEYVMVSTMDNEGIFIPAQKVIAPTDKYPDRYALEQNFPNPFNNQTKIRFQVPDVPGKFASVLLQVFSLNGEKIKTLVYGEFEAGTYQYIWDGTNDDGKLVSSGMYLCRLWTKDLMIVKKMMLIK